MVECLAVVERGVVISAQDATRPVPWWSFTKTVLAAAALVLVRDGTLTLDDPLPEKPYTLRHLLQHRSGLANYGDLAAYHEAVARGDDPWPVTVLLARTSAEHLRYPPGEGWDYSNIGYWVVRRLVEDATGQDLDAALRRLVLRPLGIASARIASRRADLGSVAMGKAGTYHPGWVYHGLLIGPVEEAALLLDRLLSGELISPCLVNEMLRVHPLPGPVHDRPWLVPGYGLGLMIGEIGSRKRVAGHTGGGPGSTIAIYRSLSGRLPRTAAFFTAGEEQGRAEAEAFRLM